MLLRGSYQEAILLQPKMSESHLNLGLIHYRSVQDEKAIEAFKGAVRLMPDSVEAHFNNSDQEKYDAISWLIPWLDLPLTRADHANGVAGSTTAAAGNSTTATAALYPEPRLRHTKHQA